MKTLKHSFTSGFSMVEVTLALGIVTFAILTTLGLLAVGLNMNQDTVANTEAASLAREVAADLQLVDTKSPRFDIEPTTAASSAPTTFYVKRDGSFLGSGAVTAEERANALYRIDVSFGPQTGTVPQVAHILVSWPVGAAGSGTWPTPVSSRYEVVTNLASL